MTGDLTEVAVYRRVVGAGIQRVWENVLDWEHLPWLHGSSFSSIQLHASSADGWRARVGLGSGDRPLTAEIDLRVDMRRSRYLTATIGGVGAGTEIWTELQPAGPRETAIEVSFRVPGVAVSSRDAVGAVYCDLYARLWDEDESMMRHRQAMLDDVSKRGRRPAAAEVDLGAERDVLERVPFATEVQGRRCLVFVAGGEILVRSAVCPHALGPLDEGEMRDGIVRCPWHGYAFDLREGRSCDGRSLQLGAAVSTERRNGRIYVRPGAV